MKFIVAAPEYREDSGGSMALHYLAHLIALEGHDSIIAATNTFPESKARLKYWERGSIQHEFCDGTEMVIYPEVITDNPLNAKHVTRWLLHKEGYHKGKTIDYGENDLIFQYNPFFTPNNRESHGILHIRWIRTDIFQNRHQRRQLFGFIVRKGKNRNPYNIKTRRHPPRSQFLDPQLTGSLKKASLAFNRVRIIICYDYATYWALCATLCGCLVIIVPIKSIPKKQYHDDFLFVRNGIAYGFLDVPRALLTRRKFKRIIEMEHESNINSVQGFISVVEQYFT